MKKIIQFLLLLLTSFNLPHCVLAQSPNVRSLSSFVFFTTTGAVSNAETSQITGDIGTGNGAVSGFVAPSNFYGSIYNADPVTTQGTIDLNIIYSDLNAILPTNTSHGAAFGSGETILPGVYAIGGAGSVDGTLNLDAEGNGDAVFILKFGGALTTGAASKVNLMNGAKACNVFWVAEGAISMMASSDMKGTFIAHPGAITMASGSRLDGRLFSTAGAISLNYVNAQVVAGWAPCSFIPGTSKWRGRDNNWQNLNNWCGGIPIITSNIIIPASVNAFPVINTGAASFNNITIEAGASLTVSGTGICNLNGVISNAGIFDITDGTLNLAGPNLTVGGSKFLNGTVKNLYISSGSSTAIDTGVYNMLRVKNNLSFKNSNNVITTNGNLTLLSTATNTASVTDITNNGTLTGNSILGNASVERFIPSLKRWRYLAVNTEAGAGSKNTIQANWMEGQAPGVNGGGAGKGLWITDVGYTANPGNYDGSSYSPSIKWYNGTSYVGIGNPTTYDMRGHTAYFTYIRGDRGSTAANGILSTTVLRTFGNLTQGDKIVNIPVAINGIGIGNPYASPIDLRKLSFSTNDIINIFVWDPNIGGGGTYGQGGFQHLSFDPLVDQNFTVIPGGGSYSDSTLNTIESGLGFFVQGSLTSRNFTFKEISKTSTQNNAFRTTVVPQKIFAKLSVRNASDSLTMVDNFLVRMASHYSTELDANDERKRTTSTQNVSTSRDGALLAIEYRNNTMTTNDSIRINSTNLTTKNYSWTFTMNSLNEPGRIAVLLDKYLGTETVLNLDSVTNYNFTTIGIADSFNVNRFMIIFRQAAVLSIEHIGLEANRLPNGTISLKWKTKNEINVNHFQTERSSNAVQFVPFGINTPATNNNSGDAEYTKIDITPNTGNIYYRIKALDNNLHFTYSQIVKVNSLDKEATIEVYPNPVTNKTIALYLKNIPFGNYQLSLLEENGERILNRSLIIDATVIKKEIVINGIASGNYQLEITNKTGFRKVMAITVVN